MDLGHFATAGGSELTKIAERGWGADDDAARPGRRGAWRRGVWGGVETTDISGSATAMINASPWPTRWTDGPWSVCDRWRQRTDQDCGTRVGRRRSRGDKTMRSSRCDQRHRPSWCRRRSCWSRWQSAPRGGRARLAYGGNRGQGFFDAAWREAWAAWGGVGTTDIGGSATATINASPGNLVPAQAAGSRGGCNTRMIRGVAHGKSSYRSTDCMSEVLAVRR
jgi:hypothetical protein